MKKIIIVLCLALTILVGCSSKEPHWSHKVCVEELVSNGWADYAYSYTVKEIEHDEVVIGNDEVHCFDITITSGTMSTRWCCFVVLSAGEVVYTDCDRWEENEE